MVSQQFTLQAARLPALLLGLFIGRVSSEAIAFTFNDHMPAVLALLVTASAVAVALWLLRWQPLSQIWPLIALGGYVVYPYPQPAAVVTAILAVAVLWLISRDVRNGRYSHWLPYFIGLALALGFFGLYTYTLAPGVLPADNGEFQVVAAQLGVAHPPGFPLYTMLAHLATRFFPAQPAALVVNQFSAVTSSLTLFVVFLLVLTISQRLWAAVLTVMALGSATTFWAQATVANVRSLTALFAALMLLALAHFWRVRRTSEQSGNGWLVAFALTFGLGVTHHPSLAFMGLVGLLFILVVDARFWLTPRRWLLPILAGVAGLLPLLYLPLRATTAVRGADPDLATWSGFLEHVLALGFQGDLFTFTAPDILWQRLRVMGNVMTFQFEGWLLVGMALGLLVLALRHRDLLLLFGGTWVVHTLITATYRAPQTVEYMLPAYIPAVVVLGLAVGLLPLPAAIPKNMQRGITAVITTFFLVVAVQQAITRTPSFVAQRQDTTTATAMTRLLLDAPPNAVVLAHWHYATPLWYLQEVDGLRTDVTVQYVAPTGEPYPDTWARLVAENLDAGRNVVATYFDETAYMLLPPPQPLGAGFLFARSPLRALPDGFASTNTMLGDLVQVVGYELDRTAVSTTDELLVTIAWRPIAEVGDSVSLFVHMVDDNGRLVGQADLAVRPQASGITLTAFRLTPQPAATGNATLLLGLAGSETRFPLGAIEVVASAWQPVTANPLYRPAAGQRPSTLIGFDWDNTLPDQPRLYLHWSTPDGYRTDVYDNTPPELLDLPELVAPWGVTFPTSRAIAGQTDSYYVPLGAGIVWLGQPISQINAPVRANSTLVLDQYFRSRRPIQQDVAVSVRLIGYDGDGTQWLWSDLEDGVPALGAIPTLKWIGGTAVLDPHMVTASADTTPGQRVGATLTIYDVFTNRRLPILDERLTARFPWVPLGETAAIP